MTARAHIRNQREANNWAVVRRAALRWTGTSWGADYRFLLDVLDGKAVLTAERKEHIRVHGDYFKTPAGDGVGDDIDALLEAITEKQQ